MTGTPPRFSGDQRQVAGLLAFLQFAVILDFMLMAPLGAVIMPTLSMTPHQFGLVVSAYAFSAGAAGLLTAGFADRFDRKKLLLFFYAGFILGTLWCGLANRFETLLAARIVTGLFGGVIGSVVMAIAAELCAQLYAGGVREFHFYTLNRAELAYAICHLLGVRAPQTVPQALGVAA